MSKHLIELHLSARAQEAASQKSFRVGTRNATATEPAELTLYGEVGDSYDAMDAGSVGKFLRVNKGKAVNVRINSPGGLAYDGITIHNALQQHDGKVTTIIEGMAGSAASIIAMAGNPVQMYENASLFIHRASVMVIGNSDMMDEAKIWLDKLDEAIARTYRAKTGLSMDVIRKQMKGLVDGTVFTAAEAKKDKYIDQVLLMKHLGKASAKGNSVALRNEAEQRISGLESLIAQRIRSRRELFAKGAVALAPMAKPVSKIGKPTAAGGPLYDVGDMVQVMEDGEVIGSGEVRSSMLGYMYDVMAADGTMMCDCCEDDLKSLGEEMA